MDMEEIRYLLGGTIFARAKAYTDRIQDLNCEVAGNGVRHLSADVRGGGRSLYQTQVWLRENGSFVSASCSCPYNENGEGPCCKHIGALLMRDSESQGLSGRAPQRPSESPESIPGVVRGTANLQTPQPEEPPRRDSYASSLEMLFGKKWRGEEPESDYEARRLLQAYQEGALAEVDGVTGHAELRPHAAELEPELLLQKFRISSFLRHRMIEPDNDQTAVKALRFVPIVLRNAVAGKEQPRIGLKGKRILVFLLYRQIIFTDQSLENTVVLDAFGRQFRTDICPFSKKLRCLETVTECLPCHIGHVFFSKQQFIQNTQKHGFSCTAFSDYDKTFLCMIYGNQKIPQHFLNQCYLVIFQRFMQKFHKSRTL